MHRWLATVFVLAFAAIGLAEDVALDTGEVFRGRIVERNEAGISMQHPVVGRIWIPAERIASVDGASLVASDPLPVTLTADEDSSKTSDGAVVPPTPSIPDADRWKWTVELGASGREGNGDGNDLRAAIAGRQEDSYGRWRFRGVWRYADSDDDKIKDNVELEAFRDWRIAASVWFPFAGVRHEWDSFEDWSKRLSLSAGIGRELIERDDLRLRARAGYFTVNESGSDEESWRPEGIVGLESEWKITENQSVDASVRAFPDLDDTDEYRTETRIQYRIKITEFDHISIALGIDNEYDSHRHGAFDRNELNYYLALLYVF